MTASDELGVIIDVSVGWIVRVAVACNMAVFTVGDGVSRAGVFISMLSKVG